MTSIHLTRGFQVPLPVHQDQRGPNLAKRYRNTIITILRNSPKRSLRRVPGCQIRRRLGHLKSLFGDYWKSVSSSLRRGVIHLPSTCWENLNLELRSDLRKSETWEPPRNRIIPVKPAVQVTEVANLPPIAQTMSSKPSLLGFGSYKGSSTKNSLPQVRLPSGPAPYWAIRNTISDNFAIRERRNADYVIPVAVPTASIHTPPVGESDGPYAICIARGECLGHPKLSVTRNCPVNHLYRVEVPALNARADFPFGNRFRPS